MKFLLATKYVGEKYANLEQKINSTSHDVQDVRGKLENSSMIYRKGLKDLKKELETYINMSTSPATKLEVMRVEEDIHKRYSALTKSVNESIVKVETDLEKAVGKKLTAREKIEARMPERDELVSQRAYIYGLETKLRSKYTNLENEVTKNITRATSDLKKRVESEIDMKYDSLKNKVYKNLSVITGSVMRDIVLITQNINDMWGTASKRGWPEGQYCLYKYGQCPDGFLERRSHIHKRSMYCCKKS